MNKLNLIFLNDLLLCAEDLNTLVNKINQIIEQLNQSTVINFKSENGTEIGYNGGVVDLSTNSDIDPKITSSDSGVLIIKKSRGKYSAIIPESNNEKVITFTASAPGLETEYITTILKSSNDIVLRITDYNKNNSYVSISYCIDGLDSVSSGYLLQAYGATTSYLAWTSKLVNGVFTVVLTNSNKNNILYLKLLNDLDELIALSNQITIPAEKTLEYSGEEIFNIVDNFYSLNFDPVFIETGGTYNVLDSYIIKSGPVTISFPKDEDSDDISAYHAINLGENGKYLHYIRVYPQTKIRIEVTSEYKIDSILFVGTIDIHSLNSNKTYIPNEKTSYVILQTNYGSTFILKIKVAYSKSI